MARFTEDGQTREYFCAPGLPLSLFDVCALLFPRPVHRSSLIGLLVLQKQTLSVCLSATELGGR